jgi:thiol-disulfide isomerase/thioredoxin
MKRVRNLTIASTYDSRQVGVVVLTSLLLGIAACDKGEAVQPQAGRFIAVTAKTEPKAEFSDFCDVTDTGNKKRAFHLPAMDGKESRSANSPLWVNIWASWCKPCIEEMPMLVQWQKRMKEEGTAFDLEFVSVDQSLDITTTFLKEHPQLPASLHLQDPNALPVWIQEMGLDSAAGLPIHVFVNREGNIRCARAAAISAENYATVKQLLK